MKVYVRSRLTGDGVDLLGIHSTIDAARKAPHEDGSDHEWKQVIPGIEQFMCQTHEREQIIMVEYDDSPETTAMLGLFYGIK